MSLLSRHLGTVNLVAGFLAGCWIGYQVLPAIVQPTLPAVGETAEARAAREALERSLAVTLLQADNVVAASVHLVPGRQRRGVPLRLAGGTASVTLTFDSTGLRPGQLDAVVRQVASSAPGLEAGTVSIFDGQGNQLNQQSVGEYQRLQFWTDITISVAKVLGILAALITLRYIIRAVGKAARPGS